ncbi:hypothetical protein GCM10011519_00780 [Marmoricola endophyticus]|uniref:DUF3043 domain-containing protein n=1 Tax=Marmoricola endophyticus TaxID=2040280 RepID=A0A917EY44_9ACTN|nr:DUF3043 domain-containing protein [Marmoricola endophyticus]GGF31238.1 hypothetical protein GCM10011519_00780 [Marmoricola endophyticus]
MFGRTKETAPQPATHEDEGHGKGRPTPTRREAEAAARERAKGGMDKKSTARAQRAQRAEQNAKMREGMRTGDERYLMERDKGPVKRFVRDFVDTRVSFMEFLLPVLVVIIVLQASTVPVLVAASGYIWIASIILLLLDVVALDWQLGRQVKARFAGTDHSPRGWRFYAFMRAIQIRKLRMPKPQRKWREPLPERY